MSGVRKDSPSVGDVHVSSTGARRRKAPISPDTKLPVTGATLAAQQEDGDPPPASKTAKRSSLDDLFDRIQKARAADDDADASVAAALVQIVHDCSCAIGAQCSMGGGDDLDADPAADDAEDKTAKRDGEWSIPFAIAKADPDQQLIFGWASVVEEGGKLIIDKQGDAILPADLEKAAYDFVLYARKHGEMHDRIGTGKLVESCVFTTEKQAALGLQMGKVGWWVGFKVDDADTWAAHKRGELPEFSIGGSGRRVPL